MRAWWLIWLCLVAPAVQAAPLDPALQRELLATYDRFNSTAAKGDADGAVRFLVKEDQAVLKNWLKKPEDRKAFLEVVKGLTPLSLEVVHAVLSRNGDSAVLQAVGTYKVTPARSVPGHPPGSIVKQEVTLTFVKQDGTWHLKQPEVGMPLDAIKRCVPGPNEPRNAYNEDSDFSLVGPIRRVEFKADHTVLVIRIEGEEICAYLPGRETLKEKGFKPEKLQPFTTVTIKAMKHLSDPLRFFALAMSIEDDDT